MWNWGTFRIRTYRDLTSMKYRFFGTNEVRIFDFSQEQIGISNGLDFYLILKILMKAFQIT